jgi:hypothetical protein
MSFEYTFEDFFFGGGAVRSGSNIELCPIKILTELLQKCSFRFLLLNGCQRPKLSMACYPNLPNLGKVEFRNFFK